jgi:hypothetical protein
MQADFHVIPTALQSLVPDFDVRMQRLRRAIVVNSEFIRAMLEHRHVFHNTPEIDYAALEQKVAREHPIDEERMGRVRSTIRQCVRDWSVEGAAERAACYGPILRELARIYPTMESRVGVKVLIPGSGLGRLVWECAAMGFHATGNEFSYYMLLCSFLILNCCKSPNIFTLHPWAHEAKNLLDPEDQLRSVTIPDVNPTELPEQGDLSMAAGDWMDIFSDLPQEYIHGAHQRKMAQSDARVKRLAEKQRQFEAQRKAAAAAAASGAPAPAAPAADASSSSSSSSSPIDDDFVPDAPRGTPEGQQPNKATWDVFASCYFIDCATSILEFLRTIAYVLRDGGHWINFGPLLYHFSEIPGEVSVDLSWKELRRAIPYFGFTLVSESFNNPSGYTSDERSMLRQQYFCVQCTWKKTGEDLTVKPLKVRPTLAEPQSVAWSSREENNSAYNRVCIPSSDTSSSAAAAAAVELKSLLEADLARLVGEETTPSGTKVVVYDVPAAKLGAFLLKAAEQPEIKLGKIVLQGREMLAALKQ